MFPILRFIPMQLSLGILHDSIQIPFAYTQTRFAWGSDTILMAQLWKYL